MKPTRLFRNLLTELLNMILLKAAAADMTAAAEAVKAAVADAAADAADDITACTYKGAGFAIGSK